MDTNPDKTETIPAGTDRSKELDTANRRPWEKPVVTRIEMKRTMVAAGSAQDATTPAQP